MHHFSSKVDFLINILFFNAKLEIEKIVDLNHVL